MQFLQALSPGPTSFAQSSSRIISHRDWPALEDVTSMHELIYPSTMALYKSVQVFLWGAEDGM